MLIDLTNPWVTQSLLGAWLRCRREARLFLEGWSPKEDKDALSYGILSHHCLEQVYRRIRKTHQVPSESALRTATRLLCLKWEMVNGQSWAVARCKAHALHSAQLEVLVPLYFEHWRAEDARVKWAAPEQVFRINLGRFTLTGRFDGAQEYQSRVYLFETKNWSFIPEDSLISTLGFDLQINFYCLALRRVIGRTPVGAILNVLRRPALAVGSKGLDDYATRLQTAVESNPGHYFKRFEVVIPKQAQESFEGELKEILNEFGEWLRSETRDTRFGMPCSVRGSLCKYVPMCHYGIRSIYVKRKALFPELESAT